MSYLTKTHKMDNFMDWASHMHVSLFIKKVLKEIKSGLGSITQVIE